MSSKPSVIVCAVLGGFIGFFTLFFVDFTSASLVNDIRSLPRAIWFLTNYTEMFMVKGALGTITGVLAGAAYALARRGRGGVAAAVALIGGPINLALLLVWVLSFALTGQVRGIPPLYVAFNIAEPTLPAFALIGWGIWFAFRVRARPSEPSAGQPPISSPS